MPQILSLKPNVTREDALRHFTGVTLNPANWFHGPVRSIAELYIPFSLFEVKVANRGREERHVFGIDAAQGVLDPYQFPSIPGPEDLMSIETRNLLPAVIEAGQLKG